MSIFGKKPVPIGTNAWTVEAGLCSFAVAEPGIEVDGGYLSVLCPRKGEPIEVRGADRAVGLTRHFQLGAQGVDFSPFAVQLEHTPGWVIVLVQQVNSASAVPVRVKPLGSAHMIKSQQIQASRPRNLSLQFDRAVLVIPPGGGFKVSEVPDPSAVRRIWYRREVTFSVEDDLKLRRTCEITWNRWWRRRRKVS